MSHFVIGTAGHIDHGKTSLVRSLTGRETDRLSEEKRRGITIELGFAPWTLPSGIQTSIVDVPGHERLVRTMVAGATGLDVAMLVIAADDGVMPQTREHLDILRLLGVSRGLTVVTKCDLVDEELLELAIEDIRETLAGTPLADAPMVTVSNHTGEGIPELTEAVSQLLDGVDKRSSEGPGFVPLDRVFTKEGYGTVATGTCLRGQLALGEGIEVWGAEGEPLEGLKIRGLQALGAQAEGISAGMRSAVNISGRQAEHIRRGMVVTSSGTFIAVDSCIAFVESLPHTRALRSETLIAHLGTSEREATVIPLSGKEIEPGSHGGVLLRFDRPIACFAGQRLVLRRPGMHGCATVAGGEILDPEPPRGKGSVSLCASQLESLRGSSRERLAALAKESRAAGITRGAIARRIPPGEAGRAVEFLTKKGHLIKTSQSKEHWVDGELITKLVKRVTAMVNDYHDTNPLADGLLEAEVSSRLPGPEQYLAPSVIERSIATNKIARHGTVLAIPGRGAAVDAESRKLMDALLAHVRATPIMPPREKDLLALLSVDEKRGRQILSFLRRAGELVKISDELHYDRDALTSIEERVGRAIADRGPLGASELKEVIGGGISRKWAIPLFEYLDKQKVTIRQGDLRKLHPAYDLVSST